MKDKINWKQKLTSRKWWAGLAGAVTMLLGILGVSESTVAQISEIIVGAGVLLGAIIGEATVDAARAQNEQTVTVELAEKEDEGDGEDEESVPL